jgi:hypothetical protein
MFGQLSGAQALQVATSGTSAQAAFRYAGNMHGSTIPLTSALKRISRRPNRTVISYLTASEATQGGLNTSIRNYPFQASSGSLPASPTYTDIARVSDTLRKKHHISEITVTDDGGKKLVYGVPVYNKGQDEYTFAVTNVRDADSLATVPTGITSPTGDPNGVDNYYHKEHKPPYATSYLLSAVLSPDYVDKTGDGITDDDLGTAIKVNYSKLPYYYKWRTPYTKATPNRGLLADKDDDKGSIIYGEKEIWYAQSIESKTKIVYFITGDRRDALGVAGWQYGGANGNNKQKYLKEIRLYSKADMSKPIKVVKFAYTYELCRGIPNSADAGSTDPTLGGKLTLSKVWFEYGNSDKGKYHPYVFTYNNTNIDGTPVYKYNHTDRWGVYKDPAENSNGLGNEQYPYTNQNKSALDANCALWHLNQVTLPTGGVINVNYEAGDYAYVQDQKAMSMTGIQNFVNHTGTVVTDIRLANGIKVNIGTDLTPPSGDPTAWFKTNYLNGSDYIYTKLYVKMATNNYRDGNSLPWDLCPPIAKLSQLPYQAALLPFNSTPLQQVAVTIIPCAFRPGNG